MPTRVARTAWRSINHYVGIKWWGCEKKKKNSINPHGLRALYTIERRGNQDKQMAKSKRVGFD
jgi:hypothetical protein